MIRARASPRVGFAERGRASFARQRAMALIGARMRRSSPAAAKSSCRSAADLTQQKGYLHGGIVGMIAAIPPAATRPTA